MVAQLIDTRIIRMLDFAGGGALSLVLIAIILVLLGVVTRFVGLSQALGAGATKR
jgi:ABC-type spermidine/putrescine transport system permease subunit I